MQGKRKDAVAQARKGNAKRLRGQLPVQQPKRKTKDRKHSDPKP